MKTIVNSFNTRCSIHLNHETPYALNGYPIYKRKRIYWHPVHETWIWLCRDCLREELGEPIRMDRVHMPDTGTRNEHKRRSKAIRRNTLPYWTEARLA